MNSRKKRFVNPIRIEVTRRARTETILGKSPAISNGHQPPRADYPYTAVVYVTWRNFYVDSDSLIQGILSVSQSHKPSIAGRVVPCPCPPGVWTPMAGWPPPWSGTRWWTPAGPSCPAWRSPPPYWPRRVLGAPCVFPKYHSNSVHKAGRPHWGNYLTIWLLAGCWGGAGRICWVGRKVKAVQGWHQ